MDKKKDTTITGTNPEGRIVSEKNPEGRRVSKKNPENGEITKKKPENRKVTKKKLENRAEAEITKQTGIQAGSNLTGILERLDEYYPADKCYLEYTTPWQLLFATILSAQCTDARVNIVTRGLFKKYPDLQAFASADFEELKDDIRSTGFYHNKAKNIIAAARELLEHYGGEVPSDIEELTKLPGVGRKTANVIRCHIFGIPSIVVDTHVKRISRKLGLTDTDDPGRAEFELMEILPKEHWIRYNIQLIRFGREICIGGRPQCDRCFLNDICVGKR